MTMNGDYSNRSKYIRVDCKPEGSFPITGRPFGHFSNTITQSM